MLHLLVVCIVILFAAGIALLILKTFFNALDPQILNGIRTLILLFAGLAIVLTLWNGRGAFGL